MPLFAARSAAIRTEAMIRLSLGRGEYGSSACRGEETSDSKRPSILKFCRRAPRRGGSARCRCARPQSRPGTRTSTSRRTWAATRRAASIRWPIVRPPNLPRRGSHGPERRAAAARPRGVVHRPSVASRHRATPGHVQAHPPERRRVRPKVLRRLPDHLGRTSQGRQGRQARNLALEDQPTIRAARSHRFDRARNTRSLRQRRHTSDLRHRRADLASRDHEVDVAPQS